MNQEEKLNNPSLSDVIKDVEHLLEPLNGLAYMFLTLSCSEPGSSSEAQNDFYNMVGRKLQDLAKICERANNNLYEIQKNAANIQLPDDLLKPKDL